MRIRTIAALVIACGAGASAAEAATMSWDGSIVPGNSFSSTFLATGTIDALGFEMVTPGASFESPMVSGVSDGSWALTSRNDATLPTIGAISGPLTGFSAGVPLEFTMNFSADVTDAFQFHTVFFDGATELTTFLVSYNGAGSFSFANVGVQGFDRDFFAVTIPLPAGGALGLAGLAAVAVRRRRTG